MTQTSTATQTARQTASAMLIDTRIARLAEVTLPGHADPSYRLDLRADDDINTVLLRYTGLVPAGAWRTVDALRQTVELASHALTCPTCVDGCGCEAGASVDCGHYGCWSAPGAARGVECVFAAVLRAHRPAHLGEAVIRRMHERYLAPAA